MTAKLLIGGITLAAYFWGDTRGPRDQGLTGNSTVQNFTIFPIGHKIDGELVVICPYCYRSAVRRASDEGTQFIHLIRITQEGGTARLDIDSCPKNSQKAPT